MGYIIPMCLAMSGALMSGVASAEVFLGAEFSDILEHGGSWNSDDGHRSITSDGDTVKLVNVGITNQHHYDQSLYYIDGFKAPQKNLEIEWNWDPQWGSTGQVGPVRSDSDKVEIEARNFSLTSDFGENSDTGQWTNKGLFSNQSHKSSIEVNVSGTIKLITGHFPIFSDPGNITIKGFRELNAEATGRMDGSGYVVRNVTVDGIPSTIRIIGTPDSTIRLLSQKSNRSDGRQTAVVEDGSPQGQGTRIQGGSISIIRNAEEAHAIVMTAHSYTEGHIDIEGAQSVTIGTSERKGEFAVQGFSQGDAASTININKEAEGTVIINGRATAESATVNIRYAGKDPLQNGDVLAAKSHPGSKERFSEADHGTPGTKTGIMNLVFSGAGAGMKGNMTAEEGSSVTADFSGDNTFFNGDITAQKGERFADGETSSVTMRASGRNAVLTVPNKVSVEDGGAFSADISGTNAALKGNVSLTGGSADVSVSGASSFTGDLDNQGGTANVTLKNGGRWTGKASMSGTGAATNVSVNEGATWKVTADSTVSTLKVSGGHVDLGGFGIRMNIGHLSPGDGNPGTFHMDLTYHDNQCSTYETAKDSDFLYVGGGTGHTFRVEATENSSINGMRDGDKLYFARTAQGVAAFDVNQEVLIRNWDKIYNKTLRVETEAASVTEAKAKKDAPSLTVTGAKADTAAPSGSVTGTSADTAAPSGAMAGAKAKKAALFMAAASAGEDTAAPSEDAASSGESTAASSEADAGKNTKAASSDNDDVWYLTPENTPLDNGFVANANAYVPGSAHNAAASIWRDNDTLVKRLGELRWSKDSDGAWGRVINRKLARSGTQAFDVSMNTLQLGYDRKIPFSFGDIFVGGAVEHSRGTEKYDDGDGSVYMTDGALYGTFVGRSGDYVDVVTKAGRLFTHYSSDLGDGGDFENWGFSASAEYGHKFDLGWSWSVEPQAQIKYSYLWGDDYTSDNGAKIYQDDTDSLVGRLGLLVAKEFGTGTENPVRIYAKGSVLHEFLGDRDETLYQDVAMHDSTDLAGTWYSAGVGANVGLSENCSLYVDAERDFGTDIKVQYRIQGGFRFEF